MMEWMLVALGAIIIVALSIYAGRLVFLVKAQKSRHMAARSKRIESMTTSIQTIAFAVEQQQCDLSEGAIRICRLLEAMPIDPLPDHAKVYPALHSLFDKVKNYPTHDARQALSKKERREQDKERGQFESELESAILEEVKILKHYNAS
jgi:hypothetical protein